MKTSLLRTCGVGVTMSVLLWTTNSQMVAAEGTDYTYYFDLYNVEVINAPGVEIAYPSWAKPNPEENITDLSYWVYDVLPYPEDRNASKYIVYPKHGIVVPVLIPNEQDQALIAQGEMFDHFPYLEKGALHYFGYDPHQGYGNMVIAGHSSYNKNSPWNYKTTFQALPISREGDKIFVYLKNEQGSFDLFEYTITESYRTHKYDVGILQHTPDSYTLTTYGCYEIGSNEDRWVNVAKLSSQKLAHSELSSDRMHASADEESSISDAQAYEQSQQMRGKPIKHAYEWTDAPTQTNTKLSIAERIAARALSQPRDAQEVLSNGNDQGLTDSDNVVAPPVLTRAQILAELLRPKMSLHQELLINARAKRLLTTRTPEEIIAFHQRLSEKKEKLGGATDKMSLRKEVVITHLLTQLEKAIK